MSFDVRFKHPSNMLLIGPTQVNFAHTFELMMQIKKVFIYF